MGGKGGGVGGGCKEYGLLDLDRGGTGGGGKEASLDLSVSGDGIDTEEFKSAAANGAGVEAEGALETTKRGRCHG